MINPRLAQAADVCGRNLLERREACIAAIAAILLPVAGGSRRHRDHRQERRRRGRRKQGQFRATQTTIGLLFQAASSQDGWLRRTSAGRHCSLSTPMLAAAPNHIQYDPGAYADVYICAAAADPNTPKTGDGNGDVAAGRRARAGRQPGDGRSVLLHAAGRHGRRRHQDRAARRPAIQTRHAMGFKLKGRTASVFSHSIATSAASHST